MRRTSLSALDRTLGFAFGLARGGLLVTLAYMGLSLLVPPKEHPPWITQAKAFPLVEQSATWLKGLAPQEIRARLGATADPTDRQTQQARDAERALRAPALPRPPTNSNPNPGETGYKPEDRRGLERLLQTNEPAAPPPPPSQVVR